MKDLMDFYRDQKVRPIEGLKIIPPLANPAKLQLQKMQELEKLARIQGLPTNHSTLDKLVAHHPALNNQMSSNHQMASWITEEEFGMGHLDLKPVCSVSSKSLRW